MSTRQHAAYERVKSHKILVKEPHKQSLASLVLLNKYYSYQDVDCWTRWLKYRTKYIKQYKEKHELVCQYCGKRNLKNPETRKKQAHSTLTLDHAYPLAKGGKKFDEKNIRIACLECNQAKQTMTEWEFRFYLLKESWKRRRCSSEYKGVITSTIKSALKLTFVRELAILTINMSN